MPLVDVVGNAASVAPAHIGATALKVGVMLELTVIVRVVVVAHWPGSGVKTYVPLIALSTTEGLQLPVIPLEEVVARTGTCAPMQID